MTFIHFCSVHVSSSSVLRRARLLRLLFFCIMTCHFPNYFCPTTEGNHVLIWFNTSSHVFISYTTYLITGWIEGKRRKNNSYSKCSRCRVCWDLDLAFFPFWSLRIVLDTTRLSIDQCTFLSPFFQNRNYFVNKVKRELLHNLSSECLYESQISICRRFLVSASRLKKGSDWSLSSANCASWWWRSTRCKQIT